MIGASSNFGLGFFGVAAAILGVTVVVGSALDVGGRATKLYRSNADSKWGIWAMSRSPGEFRAWLIAIGTIFMVGGVFMAAKSF